VRNSYNKNDVMLKEGFVGEAFSGYHDDNTDYTNNIGGSIQ